MMRRLNELGDRVWTTTLPLVFDGLFYTVGVTEMTSRGSTVIFLTTLDPADDTRLVSVDTSGQVEWEVVLPSTVGGAVLDVSGLGSAPNGDVLLGGVMDAFSIPIFAGRATVRRIDGTDGSLIWSHEGAAINRSQSAFLGDRSYLVYFGPAGIVTDSLDGQGAVVYSTTVPYPFPVPGNLPVPAFVEVGPAGQLAFGNWGSFIALDTEIVALDPAGDVSWTRLQPATWTLGDAAFTESGDLVVVENGTLGRLATRIDSTGSVVWQHPAPLGTVQYLQVEPGAADGVVLVGYDQLGVFPFSDAKIEFVDAAGMTIGQETLDQSSAAYGRSGRIARDARGNLWLGLARYEGGFDPIGGETVKVVPFGDPGSVACAPTDLNSTGAAGRLRTAGSAATAEDNLTLVVDRLPARQFVLFLNSRTPGFLPNPGGSLGDLCLGGSIGRYVSNGQIRRTSPAGRASLQLDLPSTPNGLASVAVMAGETWFFQAWYRDVVAGLAGANLTGAVSVMFR